MKHLLIISLLSFLVFSACREDQEPGTQYNFQSGDGLLVLNEGGFGKGNASASFHYADSDSMNLSVYEDVNSKKLGDVLHSATQYQEKIYLILNNSANIKVVDAHSFEEIDEITGFTSPRYLQIINAQKAYVSDLYANKVWILDLEQNTISDSIEIEGWTEEMVQIDNRVYVSSPSLYSGPISNAVYVIDTDTDILTETIELRPSPINMVVDANGKLQVFCQGDPNGMPAVGPSMHTINPDDHEDIKLMIMPNIPTAYHSRIALSPDKLTMYLLYGSLFQVDVIGDGLSYTNIPLIEANGRSLYGIDVHPVTGNLFITDAKDYNQRGTVYEYKINAVEQNSFDAGIIPSRLIWY